MAVAVAPGPRGSVPSGRTCSASILGTRRVPNDRRRRRTGGRRARGSDLDSCRDLRFPAGQHDALRCRGATLGSSDRGESPWSIRRASSRDRPRAEGRRHVVARCADQPDAGVEAWWYGRLRRRTAKRWWMLMRRPWCAFAAGRAGGSACSGRARRPRSRSRRGSMPGSWSAAPLAAGSVPTGVYAAGDRRAPVSGRRSSWFAMSRREMSHTSVGDPSSGRAGRPGSGPPCWRTGDPLGHVGVAELHSMTNSSPRPECRRAARGPDPAGRLSAAISMRRKNFPVPRSPCWAASSTDRPCRAEEAGDRGHDAHPVRAHDGEDVTAHASAPGSNRSAAAHFGEQAVHPAVRRQLRMEDRGHDRPLPHEHRHPVEPASTSTSSPSDTTSGARMNTAGRAGPSPEPSTTSSSNDATWRP